jgi:RNA-directed DNA polymerase
LISRSSSSAASWRNGHLVTGCRTAIDLDFANFLDRVHQLRLLELIGQRVSDALVIELEGLMLKVVFLPVGTRITVREATPHGGPLLPLLSNIVLNELDQELPRRGLCL